MIEATEAPVRLTIPIVSKGALVVKKRSRRGFTIRAKAGQVKFSRDNLKSYLCGLFKRGRDFCVQYEGWNLVETEKAGGSFIKVSHGAPKLKDGFIEYMELNNTGAVWTYTQVRTAFDAMRHAEPTLYETLYWWIFERSAEKPVEFFAAKKGVSERQVWRYVDTALDELVDGVLLGAITIPDESCQ